MSGERPRILYCHCAFAKVVARDAEDFVVGNGLVPAHAGQCSGVGRTLPAGGRSGGRAAGT